MPPTSSPYEEPLAVHPLDPLTESEIRAAASAVRAHPTLAAPLRFNTITLREPAKSALVAAAGDPAQPPSPPPPPPRVADVLVIQVRTGTVWSVQVALPAGKVLACTAAEAGCQPVLTPDDCVLAEKIVQRDGAIAELMRERYGVSDMAHVVCDPWSVHVASDDFAALHWRGDGDHPPPRLVQTFLYLRDDPDDNHYAHPVDVLPVVDLLAEKVVHVYSQSRPPSIPRTPVNYHRNKLHANSYLHAQWRADVLAPLDVVQPRGPSFSVPGGGNRVSWQKWDFRVGFNYREGVVLHDVRFEGRPVVWRASLVEMAVPYGDPQEPFQRKCAFDVGDYGLGYCANSLELGCDCLGHIHYFDAVLANSEGDPYTVRKAVCMHEEDAGVLWKHVDYRSGHSEARRSRKLVLSFIATVVNYEYLFYYSFMQDGSIDFEIKLSGELSTNLLSENESSGPNFGVLVAPGVNAQVHQHMFCMRLDMSVDGFENTVSEVDVVASPAGPENPYGNAFGPRTTVLKTEAEAQRASSPSTARVWRIQNTHKLNPISQKPVAYKLIPFTKGPAQPALLTSTDCAVTKRGAFATKALWVTPYNEAERFPAGEYTVQSGGGDGLPKWVQANRGVEDTDVVLWHAFGVVHVPRPEDFPVMPCEMTGFSLKPDGFFPGNPAIDLRPEVNGASACCSGHGSTNGNATNGG